MSQSKSKKIPLRQDLDLEDLKNTYDVYIVLANNSFGPSTVQFCVTDTSSQSVVGEKYYTIHKNDKKLIESEIAGMKQLRSDILDNPRKYQVFIRDSGKVYTDIFDSLGIPNQRNSI